MKICENCGKEFPIWQEINGKIRNLQRRKYCVDCSPFAKHNTREIVAEKMYCENCGKELIGNQTKYCSRQCQTRVLLAYEIQKDKGIERKIHLIKKAGGCCSVCGYSKNLAALTFHHLDPSLKTFTLDGRNLSNRGWKSILREFEKCVVLCANCHAEEHYPFYEDWQSRGVKESGSTRT